MIWRGAFVNINIISLIFLVCSYVLLHSSRVFSSVCFFSWMIKHTSSSNDEYIWRTILEFPILALSRAAQIRSGLWRRNGTGMHDQVCLCLTCSFHTLGIPFFSSILLI